MWEDEREASLLLPVVEVVGVCTAKTRDLDDHIGNAASY